MIIVDFVNIITFGLSVCIVTIFIYCKNKHKIKSTVNTCHIENDDNCYSYITFSELNSLEYNKNASVNSSNIVCSICLDEYIYDELITVLPCNHTFHKNCLDDWLRNTKTCPLCNNT